MLFAILLAAAVPASAVTAADAERAFAAAAQKDGQWTAFRRYATEDAVMFVPQVVKAQEFLKDRKDPPRAIEWWPTESYVSCDGSLAVNTGGWRRPDGAVGYFSTVWQRQADGGWKWIVDSGDGLKVPREHPNEPKMGYPMCAKDAAFPVRAVIDADWKFGASNDGTLIWQWAVEKDLSRRLIVSIWNGEIWAPVLTDKIAAPQ